MLKQIVLEQLFKSHMNSSKSIDWEKREMFSSTGSITTSLLLEQVIKATKIQNNIYEIVDK